MKPYAEAIVTVDMLIAGYRNTLSRFKAASLLKDASPAFHALFEALNWVVAIDERIGAHWAPDGVPLNWAWRDRVPSANLLRGVRWARNSVHHDWSDALILDKGARLPVRLPFAVFEWIWREVDDLPSPSHRDRRGRQVYADELAGHPARMGLDELLGMFETVSEVLEPPRWRASPTKP